MNRDCETLTTRDYIILAERDYKLCRKLEADFPEEYAQSAVAFHIQQAIEKLLKALIVLHGEQPENTNNIAKLTMCCKKLNVQVPVYLEDIADTLTLWEQYSGYDPFIVFSEKKYVTAKEAYRVLSHQLSLIINSYKQSEDESPTQTM